MIIAFAFSNFRSIKDEQFFSMEAGTNKSKSDNIFEVELADKTELKEASKIKLVKSAVVYGANASGKSNFIRAFTALKYLITKSNTFKVDETIRCHESFELEQDYESKPTKFQITFIAKDLIKYFYEVEYNGNEIFVENLSWYPKGQPSKLFERITKNSSFHQMELGSSLREKPKQKNIFKNQLFLSKFGSDEPNNQLTELYRYFANLEIWDSNHIERSILKDRIIEEIKKAKNQSFEKRLNKLIKIADTKIEGISLKEAENDDFRFPDFFPDELKKRIVEDNKDRVFAKHILYKNSKAIGIKEIDFEEESSGTNILFALGGLILKKLETGGVIVYDELDNSLHPKLCKFLIRLFNNPVSNPKNAQLIFATHEVTLLDKDIFRKDQIWFTEKNKFGQTELFSAQDVEGLRDDTNFEIWYRTGKFGGNPNIKEVEFIFGDE